MPREKNRARLLRAYITSTERCLLIHLAGFTKVLVFGPAGRSTRERRSSWPQANRPIQIRPNRVSTVDAAMMHDLGLVIATQHFKAVAPRV